MEENNNKRFALPLGTILRNGDNEYKVVKVLGAGGFGITYKVSAKIKLKNVTGNFFFALKEFFMAGCDRADDKRTVVVSKSLEEAARLSKEDFITEARRLNHLSGLSKHIVQVNEVFKENNTAYYVMEYLDGGNLQDIVKKDGPIEEQNALELIKPVAEAVSLIHKEFILHQDIKPENIVLKQDSDTGGTYPVLIDFGISKHFSKDGKPTSAPLAKGASDGYAPIEQYSRIESFQPKIDVYALGATLLYLLSGKSPKSAFEITAEQIRACLPQSVSQTVTDAVLHAMRKLQEERTPDVESFMRECRLDFVTDRTEHTGGGSDVREYRGSVNNINTTKALNSSRGRNYKSNSAKIFNSKKFLFACVALILVGVIIFFIINFSGESGSGSDKPETVSVPDDSTNGANPNDSANHDADNSIKTEDISAELSDKNIPNANGQAGGVEEAQQNHETRTISGTAQNNQNKTEETPNNPDTPDRPRIENPPKNETPNTPTLSLSKMSTKEFVESQDENSQEQDANVNNTEKSPSPKNNKNINSVGTTSVSDWMNQQDQMDDE